MAEYTIAFDDIHTNFNYCFYKLFVLFWNLWERSAKNSVNYVLIVSQFLVMQSALLKLGAIHKAVQSKRQHNRPTLNFMCDQSSGI